MAYRFGSRIPRNIRQHRHPCERWADQFRILTNHRFWAKHPETFAKSRAGQQRRAARRFVITHKTAWSES